MTSWDDLVDCVGGLNGWHPVSFSHSINYSLNYLLDMGAEVGTSRDKHWWYIIQIYTLLTSRNVLLLCHHHPLILHPKVPLFSLLSVMISSFVTISYSPMAGTRASSRPEKLSANTALAAAASLLKRRRSIRSKKHYHKFKYSHPKTSVFPPCDLHEQSSRPRIRNPTMTLISLEEAARRSELTKELYLYFVTSSVHETALSDFPQTLISLHEAANRDELTKRLYFWNGRRWP